MSDRFTLRAIWRARDLTPLEKVMKWLGWTRRDITRRITCAWCAETFTWSGEASSDPPRFCGNTHKVLAARARNKRQAAQEAAKPKEPKEPKPRTPKPPLNNAAVERLPEPPTPTPAPTGCHCRNHMGTEKNRYPSNAAAAAAILHRHLRYGPHRVYKCPDSDYWHVTSQVTRTARTETTHAA